MSRGEPDPESHGPRPSWAAIGVVSTSVAVAAVTATVIIVATEDANALASAALALAILAFIIQIVVFAVQTWTTGQLNAETRSLLVRLDVRASGTERLLGSQVDKLTDHILSSVVLASKTASTDGLGYRQLRTELSEVLAAPGASLTQPVRTSTATSARDERLARLLTFPLEDEAAPVVPILRALKPLALGRLKRFADDARDSLRAGLPPGLPLPGPQPGATMELVRHGLIRDETTAGGSYGALTDDGFLAARILLGSGTPPSWLLDAGLVEPENPKKED